MLIPFILFILIHKNKMFNKKKRTGSTYPNGQQCQVSIKSYTDNIAGMSPEPASATFTLQK